MEPGVRVRSSSELYQRTPHLKAMKSLSGTPETIPLFYQKSVSVVARLIEHYGEDRFRLLIGEIAGSNSIDRALLNVYGFDDHGLDNSWAGLPIPAPVGPRPHPPQIPVRSRTSLSQRGIRFRRQLKLPGTRRTGNRRCRPGQIPPHRRIPGRAPVMRDRPPLLSRPGHRSRERSRHRSFSSTSGCLPGWQRWRPLCFRLGTFTPVCFDETTRRATLGKSGPLRIATSTESACFPGSLVGLLPVLYRRRFLVYSCP